MENNKWNGIEADLLEFESWDESEYMSIMFHDVTLKKDIGIHKKGCKFKWCLLDFNNSTISFGNEEPLGNYKLKLDVLCEENVGGSK